MTNPSLPKPLIHSPPTPPTPPPAKQIHISHKTPSPSTTPRISITTRTSNAAEPPVPVSSPSTINIQVTLNTTIATPTATALPTQTQHTDRVVPNSDTTSYRPISLLSVVAKTLEKCLLPYITANITQTPTQHGYKAQHSTVTALHTLNNTVAKGFNQMAPPAQTITVALDMSKAFDTVNTHTLIGKLLQTSTPGTILKFVAPEKKY